MSSHIDAGWIVFRSFDDKTIDYRHAGQSLPAGSVVLLCEDWQGNRCEFHDYDTSIRYWSGRSIDDVLRQIDDEHPMHETLVHVYEDGICIGTGQYVDSEIRNCTADISDKSESCKAALLEIERCMNAGSDVVSVTVDGEPRVFSVQRVSVPVSRPAIGVTEPVPST